jgi:maleylpyruvate isomerase
MLTHPGAIVRRLRRAGFGSVAPVSAEEEALEGARASHARLMVTLEALDDEQAWAPSLLPGWTRGHVLTHVARNADGHRRLLEAALRGEAVPRYPGGDEQRTAEIEAGARRPAAELVDDVASSAARLEHTWEAMTGEAWARPAQPGGVEPPASLPFKRWREVEVHHVDLGLGYGIEDWPASYVRLELHAATLMWRARMPMGQTELPPASLELAPNQRLAWLIGRRTVAGLPPVPAWR